MIVTYRGIDRTAAMEASVRVWAAELDSVCDGIARCDVVVETLPVQQRREQRYRVRLAIAIPGGEIVVSFDAEAAAFEDPAVAVRDSFQAARRRLEQYVWRNLPREPDGPGAPVRAG